MLQREQCPARLALPAPSSVLHPRPSSAPPFSGEATGMSDQSVHDHCVLCLHVLAVRSTRC